MQGILNVSDMSVTNGIEPPSRMNTAFLPKPFSSARCAAAKKGCVYGATQGLPELSTRNSQVTDLGSRPRTCFSTSFTIFCGFWLGTRRVENFAQAFAGITVLAPSPM